ncbi:MAG: HAMP domain-containing sensor histidine kinase [Eubacteriales bacterium]|nr:HAMP domain-containing sensor histidine kinase [Eubacteriales bacterium]
MKNQLRKESRYDYINVNMEDGKVIVTDNFVYNENGVIKVVLDVKGNLIKGIYPDASMEKLKPFRKRIREVRCGDTHYYVYDRSIIKGGENGVFKTIAIIRCIVDKSGVSSGYRTLKYASYICAAVIVLLATAISSVFSKKIVEPIKKICDTAENIGDEKNLSQRIEYEGDFQEIKILEQANNRMLDRLEEMFEKQKQFSSDVTHELKTPVSVIMAQCQYARKHIHDKEEFNEAIDLIERQVKKTNSIITQLLQLSRLDQKKAHVDFEYADLSDIVEEVCENEKLKDEKNIHLELSLEKAEARVDVSLLMIAIRNLINNAMKYSDEDSTVDIILKKEKNQVVLTVKDFGCGMSETDKKYIFDRFYRADKARNSEGFGLGLSITAKIVEIHSGTITVESELGEGSTFFMALPEGF